jgi:cytochrome c
VLQRIGILLYVGLAFLLAGIFFVSCQQEMEKMAPVDLPKPNAGPNNELAASVERGKALFNDSTLGTSGMTCNSCHIEGATKDNPRTMMGMTIDAFDNLGARYPQYVPMVEKVVTLPAMINFCIANPLKGEPLPWHDQKLIDLTSYCASIKKVK